MADLELVPGLARLVARGREPRHRLRCIVRSQRQEADVLPCQRLSAEVAERREVLDALAIEIAGGVELATEERKVAKVHERRRKRPRRTDDAGLLGGGCEVAMGGIEVSLLPCEYPEHVEGVGAQL